MPILPFYTYLGHLVRSPASVSLLGLHTREAKGNSMVPGCACLLRAILYILPVKCPTPVAIMLLDPKRLIDRSIADLTQLSALLTAEISDDAALRSPELRACEEAVATIDCLIPRLQVARNARIAPLRSGACPNCDD
jgi:hypothetical protein